MSAQTCPGMPISNQNSTFSNIVVKQRVFFSLKSVQLSVLHNPAKIACLGKIWFSWNRLSANQIAPFFKSQYLMNLFNRYVHIFHGGRPNWEEVIDIFHDVTCLPKHARACPYRTEIALSPILLLNNVYFLVLNLFSSVSFIIQRKPHVWEKSGSRDILKKALSQSDCPIFQISISHEPLK